MQAYAGRARDQPVGDHRRQAPGEEGVLAVLSPAARDVCPAFERLDEARNIAWIVLQIAIGRDDDPPARVVEPGRKRPPSGRNCGGTESRADGDRPRCSRLQDFEAPVRTAIVHDDDFVRAPCRRATRASAPRGALPGPAPRSGPEITTLRSVSHDGLQLPATSFQ